MKERVTVHTGNTNTAGCCNVWCEMGDDITVFVMRFYSGQSTVEMRCCWKCASELLEKSGRLVHGVGEEIK